jgi:hypothetical protein
MRRRHPSILVGDAVPAGQFGTDHGLATQFRALRIVVQRIDQITGEFRSFGVLGGFGEGIGVSG